MDRQVYHRDIVGFIEWCTEHQYIIRAILEDINTRLMALVGDDSAIKDEWWERIGDGYLLFIDIPKINIKISVDGGNVLVHHLDSWDKVRFPLADPKVFDKVIDHIAAQYDS